MNKNWSNLFFVFSLLKKSWHRNEEYEIATIVKKSEKGKENIEKQKKNTANKIYFE